MTTNDSGASVEAIQHHYDVGNRFYATFLDEHMVYSSALYAGDDDTLEAAQLRKLDYHLEQSQSRDAQRVLDIGCGWGSLLRRGIDQFAVKSGCGLTLSREQQHYVDNLKLPNIEVRLERWQDHQPEQLYDAIISIGAFEHFVKRGLDRREREAQYRDFFASCWRWLKPGGRLSLQTITYDNMSREQMSDFIANEIFPESDLPKAAEVFDASDGLFTALALRNDAQHYERTCREWLRRLKQNREAATSLVGDDQVEQYWVYLKASSIGFRVKRTGLLRITFEKLDDGYRSQ